VSNTSLERSVGQLEAGQLATNSRLDKMEQTLAGQDDKLDKLLAIHNQRKGARTLTKTLIGAVTSGGFIGWLWEHLHK
jgi:hypothetical protein